MRNKEVGEVRLLEAIIFNIVNEKGALVCRKEAYPDLSIT